MGDLIWIGNTLYPRWVVLLAAILMIGGFYGLQMLIRRLLQRDGKNL